MTVSHWRLAAHKPAELDCDLCIVGAGICGVSAAIEAERRGLRTIILERHTLASGASSRNAGFLMRGAADHYADATRLYGRERAQHVWRFAEENIEHLREEGIESLPSYRRIPSVLLALSEAQVRALEEARRLLREDGFDVEWLSSGTDSAWKSGAVLAALVNPHDASINPVDMLEHLAQRLKAPVRENEEVAEIREDGKGVSVRTARTLIRAQRVLLATNAYAALLAPSLANLVTPRRGQMLAIRGASLKLDASYYANHGSEYFRQTAGGDGTVVVGGCRTYFAEREVGYEDKTTGYVQGALEQFARRLLGTDWQVVTRWSGTMGFSPDGLPLIGPVPDFAAPASPAPTSARVWFCGGFTGHGMSLGFKTARAAVRAMLGLEENPFPLSRVLSHGPAAAAPAPSNEKSSSGR